MIDEYTRLLESVAEHDDAAAADAAVTKLIQHLVSTGRVKILPQIVRELRKVAARRKAFETVVEAASEHEAAAALRAAADEGLHARRARVNHGLIAGWRARGNGKLVDRSAKRALVDIYQRVTGS